MSRRLGELETRCEELSRGLTERDEALARALAKLDEASVERGETLKQLQLGQLVSDRRLDEAVVQFRHAATGLFERIESVRSRERP